MNDRWGSRQLLRGLARHDLGMLWRILYVAACLGPGVWAAPAAVPVVVEQVRLEQIGDRVEALGTLEAQESIALTVKVSGIVRAVHFADCQRVQAGDRLIELDDTEERALLQEARVRLDEAERQYRRIAALAAQRSAAQAQLDERRRDLDAARAAVAVLEARLADRLIRAPFAGVLGLRAISPGALVTPGTLITTLDDDRVMKLDFTVSSIHLAALRPGLPIEAQTDAFGDEGFRGTVQVIDSRIDPVSRAVRVRATLPNPDLRLKPGLLMRVILMLNPRTAPVIPESAVLYRGPERLVMRVIAAQDGALSAEPQQVRLGLRLHGLVEVREGLDAGERVIIAGQDQVRPRQPVRLVEPLAQPAPDDRDRSLRPAPGRVPTQTERP
ncbi:efflux RND transporter periplasmic adaptor subunit [Caldichromatium japonicum]|uniref:Efflux RND transporter periplasmic adaptor subunit n=1 Tax=Caldichromatium japonicum TaxID=2699430 RepID=A0A6G7VAS4_9GAMM|nr:efflux RND transporter periplasmic adaptor subunit [Caldichromatium japonicum]QIK37052.1 efflux RND transporter periplasmic adaptor subunit [Caldichromatium japonicum]